MQKSDQFVQVGQVLKSDGTDGSLVIRLFDNFYESPRCRGDFSHSGHGGCAAETAVNAGDKLEEKFDNDLDGIFSSVPFWIMIDGLPVPYFADFVSDKAGGKLIVRLTDIISREDADALAGKELYHRIDDNADARTSYDENLEDMDLRGWKLVDTSTKDAFDGNAEDRGDKVGDHERKCQSVKGRVLGIITGVESIPGNPLLIIELADNDAEVLIPIHDDLVTFIDADQKILGMSVPEGLLYN